MDKDALINAIGQALASDDALSGDWDGYALIAWYGDDSRRLSGFRYREGVAPAAATPKAARIGDLIDDLRSATVVQDKAPWDACVIRIHRGTGKLKVEFAYDDDARQWDIRPATLSQVAESARPAA